MHATTRPWSPPHGEWFWLRLAAFGAWLSVAVTVLITIWPGSSRASGWGNFWLVLTLLIAFGAALMHCLRRPSTATLTMGTYALLLAQSVVAMTVSSDLLYVLALELGLVLPRRVAWRWFALQLIATLVLALVLIQDGSFVGSEALRAMPKRWQVALTLAEVLGWQLLAFAGGMVAATHIRALVEVRRLMAEVDASRLMLEQTTRSAERMHIARELHDTLGHRLAALGVHLDLASRHANGATADALREAHEATRGLLAEVRDVVGTLRRPEPLELKRAIARRLEQTAGLQVELAVSPGFEVREASQAHALFRCAQEALANTLRHASARRVELELRQDASGTMLRVKDDGVGVVDLREGNGLQGMRERVVAIGGRLDFHTAPRQGFEVRAWFPPQGSRV